MKPKSGAPAALTSNSGATVCLVLSLVTSGLLVATACRREAHTMPAPEPDARDEVTIRFANPERGSAGWLAPDVLVSNGAPKATTIGSSLWLDRLGDGGPSRPFPWSFPLEPNCDGGAPQACLLLAPGGTVRFERWHGDTCEQRCSPFASCDKNAVVTTGEYRFSVRSCDGTREFVGRPFHWPPRDEDVRSASP